MKNLDQFKGFQQNKAKMYSEPRNKKNDNKYGQQNSGKKTRNNPVGETLSFGSSIYNDSDDRGTLQKQNLDNYVFIEDRSQKFKHAKNSEIIFDMKALKKKKQKELLLHIRPYNSGLSSPNNI